MTSVDPDSDAGPSRAGIAHLVAVFFLSASLIALQILLMRHLSITRWYHFAYLVVSTALLGFGIAGTLLAFIGKRLLVIFDSTAFVLTLLFALSIPLCLRFSQSLPIDVQYLFFSWRQVFLLAVNHLLLLLPFLLGASIICLSLMAYTGDPARVYAANLGGSGFGAGFSLLMLHILPPQSAMIAVATFMLIIGPLWIMHGLTGRSSKRSNLEKLAVIVVAIALFIPAAFPVPKPAIDQYKAISELRRWQAQGQATRIATRHSPRARLDLFSSPRLHNTLFAGLGATEPPPSQLALLSDGHLAGTIFRIARPGEAEILDHTPQSLPYSLVESPSVLLLGETGGTNIWLARGHNASRITVVQPNPQIAALLEELTDEDGAKAFSGPDIEMLTMEPRRFIEETDRRFDIIQIAELEGMAAGVSGLLSLHETHLLTVEGIATCLDRLTDRGILCITRGLQTPPRDNPKLLLTFAAACLRSGIAAPRDHLLQAHNYLAACNLAFRRPPGDLVIRRLTERLIELGLLLDHAPGEVLEYAEDTGVGTGDPEDRQGLAYTASRLMSDGRDLLLKQWAYDLRPARDDRPYFFHFFRARSIPKFFSTYGRHWLQRMELGYLVLIFVLCEVLIVGLIMLIPHWIWRRAGKSNGYTGVTAYFASLGLGYLMVEMVFIQRLTLLLGDPIYAAALTISVLLIFSGLGSFNSRKLKERLPDRPLLDGLGIAVLIVMIALILIPAFGRIVAAPPVVRFAVAGFLLSIPAYFMGRPFPLGLSRLHRAGSGLVPYSWAVNGFASVAAAPLAVMLAVYQGFLAVSIAAALIYVLASYSWILLPDRAEAQAA